MKKGLTGATGNMYCGLLEYNDMGFLLHFLRPDDLFVDIGANVGAYTILASAEIKATTIAVEPSPITFKNLNDNISLNHMQDKVKAFNIGLGSKKEKTRFTKSLDTVNHVATDDEADSIEVEFNTLDSILSKEKSPILIKIDVEGFETEVLSGADKSLANDQLKAIIIELNGSGQRYGFDENKIHKKLIELGFNPFIYNPKTRQLVKIETFGHNNTIYIRDRKFVETRILSSRNIRIGHSQYTI